MAILPTATVLPPQAAGLIGAGQAASPLQIPREIPLPELEKLAMAVPVQGSPAAGAPSSFEDVLGRMVTEVNGRQLAAADKVQGLLSGQEVSLHETMVSLEEASLSFQLMVEVRNKLLESYQELMRMQV